MIARLRLSITGAIICTVVACSTGLAQTEDRSPRPRQFTKKEIDARHDQAKSYAKQRNFELALVDYLFVFDNSRGVAGYGGVRLSFVLRAIAEMVTAYPPARKALKERRDEREEFILAGRAGFDEIQELTSLNKHLDESSRSVELFDKLKKMGPAYAEMRDDMLNLIWEELVEAKRYDDLGDKIVELARQVASRIAEYKVNADFPGGTAFDERHQRYLRDRAIKDGGKAYQVLLSIGKTEIAAKLLNWLLDFQSDGKMFGHLIDGAIKAGQGDVARQLVERARKSLTQTSDLTIVEEAESRIPKRIN